MSVWFILSTKVVDINQLYYNSHFSYTRNINVINKARLSNFVLLSLPSQCTQKLQPLNSLAGIVGNSCTICLVLNSWVVAQDCTQRHDICINYLSLLRFINRCHFIVIRGLFCCGNINRYSFYLIMHNGIGLKQSLNCEMYISYVEIQQFVLCIILFQNYAILCIEILERSTLDFTNVWLCIYTFICRPSGGTLDDRYISLIDLSSKCACTV